MKYLLQGDSFWLKYISHFPENVTKIRFEFVFLAPVNVLKKVLSGYGNTKKLDLILTRAE